MDWRWKRVCELSEMLPARARIKLEDSQDPFLTAGYEFKKAADRRLETPNENIAESYDLFVNRQNKRPYIEAMLLCGIAPGDFCRHTSYEHCPGTIGCYEALFFDVRRRRHQTAWVVEQLFSGFLYDRITPRDKLGLAHRLAWFCGPDLFHSFSSGEWDPAFRVAMTERLKDMFYKMSYIQSFCRAHAGDIDLETMRVVITDIRDIAQREMEKAKAGGSEDLADATMAFLEHMPLSVADPSLEANLTLPARDPRVEDLMAAATQQAAREMAEAQ